MYTGQSDVTMTNMKQRTRKNVVHTSPLMKKAKNQFWWRIISIHRWLTVLLLQQLKGLSHENKNA
jgi:hypothetical protein